MQQRTHLRLMTFNIFLTTLPADEIEFFSDVWANRSAFNVATIRRYRPDVIGFQEFDHGHWQTYQTELADYAQYGADEATGTPIFWKADRFEKIDTEHFWLGDDPLVKIAAWGAEDPLSATWARLKCSHTGRELLVLNTHLDDGSEEARIRSTALILDRLVGLTDNGSLPALLTGDFNCNPGSMVYDEFVTRGFMDAYRAAGHGDSANSSTFHGFHGGDYFALDWGGEVFWRVDWILAHSGRNSLYVTSCTIARDAQPPVYASDHYPVVAELVMMG
jgi:endonuclease/exonuclease/phosphatase family metal-dependent hydrolase